VKQCAACLEDNFIQVNAEATWKRNYVIIQQGCRNSSVQQLHLHLQFYSTCIPYLCELVLGTLKVMASHMYYFPLFTDAKTHYC